MSEIIEFFSEDNQTKLSVRIDAKDDTVWLNLNQISYLFERDKSVISRHLRKIYESSELERDSTVAFFATVQEEGGHQVTRNIEHFSLDAILSVGYRVNSKKGIEFRRWVSQILKQYLLDGFSLNKDKLLIDGFGDLLKSIDLLKRNLIINDNLSDISLAAIDIIHSYAKSWLLLNAFDEDRLEYNDNNPDHEIKLTEVMIEKGILDLKSNLIKQNEANSFFGVEREDSFKQIIGGIHQTFDGKMLYSSVCERAAHLFYFTIKDHPFTDGNKRIGSFLLILYLSSYGVNVLLSNEALVALALLIAQSDPCDKNLMIKLILNLIVQ